MFYNYTFKRLLGQSSFSNGKTEKGKPNLYGFALVVLMLLFSVTGIQAQTTTIIGSSIGGTVVADGTFSTGSTFSANGWTVVNGVSPIRWEVGSAVTQTNGSNSISGNSGYVSTDGGASNGYVGFGQSVAVYFYKDVTIPAGQTNIALSFNWRSVGEGNTNDAWQVLAMPTTSSPVPMISTIANVVPPIPTITAHSALPNAVSLGYGFNSNNGTTVIAGTVQSAYINIPASYAGTTFRLVFMWGNDFNNGNNTPAAIDNISLVSRTPSGTITSAQAGNWSNPATWTGGVVPSFTNDVSVGHNVVIDGRNYGCKNLTLTAGILSFGAISDQLTVGGDLTINSGATLNAFTSTGATAADNRKINVSGNIANEGRLDISQGDGNNGVLNLIGSTVQTVGGGGAFGGTNATTTTANTANVINNVWVTNTSASTPNVIWNVNNIRIKSAFSLTKARVGLGTNKIIIGNYTTAGISNYTIGNGFIGGTVSRYTTVTATSTGAAILPGVEYNGVTLSVGTLYPILTATGHNRAAYIVKTTAATTAGEIAVAYSEVSGFTSDPVTDGAYAITDRYNSSWSITTPATSGTTYAGGTHAIGFYDSGEFSPINGNSRIMRVGAVVGTHQNGTVSPFVVRTGLSVTDLTGGSLYVGVASADKSIITSAVTSGNWSNPATWSTNAVPTCSDFVTIASGTTVVVNTTGNVAAGVNVVFGGTLINSGGDLTVGCTNNNAVFNVNGTHTLSGGSITVNGSVIYNTGSTFNHTGGNFTEDGNAGGVISNSVSGSTALFRINNATLNLTGGNITIVDPPAGNTTATTQTTAADFTATTVAATVSGGSVLTFAANTGNLPLAVGQLVSGTGIATGTTVASVGSVASGTISLSLPTTAAISSGAVITFGAMSAGGTTVTLSAANAAITTSQYVYGTGIPAGTIVSSISGTKLTLSAAITTTNTSGGVNLTFVAPPDYSFVYNSPNNYAAGLNHTLQIGDGVSTDKGASFTNGFNVNFQSNTGQLSLGNYTLDPTSDTERYVTGIATLNVQNTFLIASGTFKVAGGLFYFGGDILNYGTAWFTQATTLGNFINGVAVPTGIAQTIGGPGTFYNNAVSSGDATTLEINNISPGGVTLGRPFRVTILKFTNGVLHTTGTNIIKVGSSDITTNTAGAITGTPNSSNYIDGPMEKFYNGASVSSSQINSVIPVGKGSVYAPLNLGVTGAGATFGNYFRIEAFSGNSGSSVTSNISGLGATRWEITPVTVSSSPYVDYNVRLGAPGVSSTSIPVKASAATGTYDSVFGTTATFAAGTTSTPNTVQLNAAQLQSGATALTNGAANYFGFAFPSACSTIVPGSTLPASTSNCSSQGVTLSLQNQSTLSLNNGVTYQWQSSANNSTWANISGATASTYVATPTSTTYYRCNVTCSYSVTTVASDSAVITFSNSVTSTTGASGLVGANLTLQATPSAGVINWYDTATSLPILSTGNSFAVNNIQADRTVYAAAEVSTNTANGGRTIAPTSSIGIAQAGEIFNTANKIILNSVVVYPQQVNVYGAGLAPAITIQCFDSAGVLVPGCTKVFTPNSQTTLVAQTVPLGFTIPAGNGYRLLVTGGVNTFDNKLGITSSGVTYPVTNGVVTFVSRPSDWVSTPSTSSWYYFHNWNFNEVCSSARVPVVANVITIQYFNFYADTDGDGVGAGSLVSVAADNATTPPPGYSLTNTDCAPTDNTKWRTGSFYVDSDADGYSPNATQSSVCYGATTPAGYSVTSAGLDCNDSNNTMHQQYTFYVDSDRDGYGSGSPVSVCAVNASTEPFGYAVNNLDCSPNDNKSWQSGNLFVDNDGDHYTVGDAIVVCYGANIPAGYSEFSLGEDCNDNDSNATEALLITSQPAAAIICSTAGSTASFSVATSITANSYTWQYRVVNAANPNPAWITITSLNAGTVYSAFTTGTLGVTRTTTLPAVGTQYRVLIGSNCGEVVSNSAAITVLSVVKAGSITTSTNVCLGGSLTMTLTGYAGTSIQWQSSPISTATAPGVFTNISGATGTTLTLTNATFTMDRSYRAVVSNSCNSTTATTATKTITINPISIGGTATGGGVVCSGGSGSLKLAGYVGIIQWEYSTNGVNYSNAPKAADAQTIPFGTTSASSTTSGYLVTGISTTVYFRAKVTSGACSSSYSNVVQYTIGTAAVAGTITPASTTLCPGTGTTLTLSSATGVVTWQKSTNWLTASPTWTSTTNHTMTYATGNLAASTAFRAMVTIGTCSTVYSDLAYVYLVARPVAKTITGNVTSPTGSATAPLCTTDASKILTEGAGYIGTIQWQWSTTSTTAGFSDILGATNQSYTVTNPAVGANYYRVVLSNTCGVSVNSTAITVNYKSCTAPKAEVKVPFNVMAYPNPYRDNFNLSLSTSSESIVAIKVYDMLGKLIETHEVHPSSVSELLLGDRYASGIYNVVITQGSEVKTLRIVKQ